jgi:glycosyltransferase involved in cell wall biosynthesis
MDLPCDLETPMEVIWLAKRHYTHKDALADRFGRTYELPLAWSRDGAGASLELVDYHGRQAASHVDGRLEVHSTPIRRLDALRDLRRRVLARKPDVIVASSDCFAGMLGLHLARASGARFVFDVYDDYRTFGAYRLFAGFPAYAFLLRRATLVLYASRAVADRHDAASPWTFVPNGVDPALFRPGTQAAARAAVKLADGDTRWIGYFGGLEAERGPEDLVAAVGLLHARDPAIRLALCGPTVPGQNLRASWVELRGSIPHATVPDYINACDVVALPYRRGPVIDMASSLKMAEYLYCMRPIVATRTPSLTANFPIQAQELGEAIAEPGNVADLARAIEHQLLHPTIASIPKDQAWAEVAERALASIKSAVAARSRP